METIYLFLGLAIASFVGMVIIIINEYRSKKKSHTNAKQ